MNKKKEFNKVICIGMHKTGTTTLGLALLDLGYNVLGARTDLADILLEGKIEETLEVARPYNALQDVPWALLYKELDKKYPNSIFILTERDENNWLNSVLRHFANTYIPLHEWIYGKGIALGNEDIYLEKYKKHYKEVKEYFKNKPEDLLIISLSNGDGWIKLCSFLGHEVPNKKFPYANKGKHNLSLIEKGYNIFRAMIPTPIRRKLLDMLGFPDKRNRFNNHYENKEYRRQLKDKAERRQ